MHSTLLKPMFIVTEGVTDAPVIISLINTGERTVYQISSGGYQNIASVVRTQYLMYGDDYNYVVVFDSDSESDSERRERLAMVKYLSGADLHSKNIGVFCFRNTLEKELGLPKMKGKDNRKLISLLKKQRERMQQCLTIREIQSFVDSLS